MNAHIIDNVFLYSGAKSASLWGDNHGLGPAHFSWVEGADKDRTCFFTDAAIYEAERYDVRRRVAWLCEPPGYREAHYQYINDHHDRFDYILTHDRRLLDKFSDDPRFLYYPMGGSMISRALWGLKPKSKLVSMIVSWKTEAAGHKLRHQIIQELRGDPCWLKVDVLGSGYGDHVRKYDALRDYAYTIVVEGERCDYFVGEKSVDAYSVGTVPIYWGCQNYQRMEFDKRGIIPFSTIDELAHILRNVSADDYISRSDAVRFNLDHARQYACCEDWIFNHYPFLFEEEN